MPQKQIWRIVDTSTWDINNIIDNFEPTVEICGDTGRLQFACISIELDISKDCIGKTDILGYSFIGNDEREKVSGWGYFIPISKSQMKGKLHFHFGDSSDITIEREC
jgi:hypothetical protein